MFVGGLWLRVFGFGNGNGALKIVLCFVADGVANRAEGSIDLFFLELNC